jgi:YfdX protein
MNDTRKRFVCLLAIVILCFGAGGCGKNPQASSTPPASSPARAENDNQNPPQQDVRPDIEQRRQQAQEEAQKTIDQEAVGAIEETKNVVKEIADNRIVDALAGIERATGTINVLLARYPVAALIPVAAEVHVIDLAPTDRKSISNIVTAVNAAMLEQDFPSARVLLHGLTSEVRVRTYNLPLETYPSVLRDAARLLDQQKNKEASDMLITALNTLTVVDRVDPLPLLIAQKEINKAESLGDKDKDAALKLLADSRMQLERAKALGYAGKDPEYDALNNSISNLEKQLKGNVNTLRAFTDLRDQFSAFFKKQSGTSRHS